MPFLDDIPDLDLPPVRATEPEQRIKRACVVWKRPRCPFCDSADVPVTNSNHVPYRYHHCRACGRNFTSLEANYVPPGP